jgi:hypothetical protein
MADLPSTYSPDEVMISFCGQDITGGMGDGDFISVEPAAEEYTTKTGADGSKARAKNLDRGAVAKITTLATGTANAILHALLAADAAGPFSMRDLNGSALVEAPMAWIRKRPTVARGKEVGTQEWEIELAEATWTLAGASPTIATGL